MKQSLCLSIQNLKSEIQNGSRSSSAQSAACAQKAFVVAHYQLRLYLRDRVHCNADQDKQRGAAEIELIAHARRNPAESGRAANEGVQPCAYERKTRDLESAQHELRNERNHG